MIIGERIYLKAFDAEDVPVRTKWMNDPDVRKYLNAPYPVSEASTKNWLNNLINDPSRLDFTICLKDSDIPIGYTGYRDIDLKNRKAESYTGIGEMEHRGKGYAKESKILSLHYIFKIYSLNRIYAYIRSDHKESIELNKTIGYKVEGVLRQDLLSGGEYRDMVVTSILADEFHKKHGHAEI